MENNSTSSGGVLGSTNSANYVNSMPSREKYWSEITSDEKIERMRTKIKYKDYLIEDMQKKLNRLEEFFYKHQHSDRTGKILVEPNQYDYLPSSSLGSPLVNPYSKPDEVFF